MKNRALDLTSPRQFRHYRALSLSGLALLAACAVPLADDPPAREVAEQTSELVCSGGGCTCGPTFGIGFVQGTYGSGTYKNFEVVVPHAGGGFSHYFRDNAPIPNADYYPTNSIWYGPAVFGSGDVGGVALIQSTLGGGNLEVVATVGSQLVAYSRARDTQQWVGPTVIASGVVGQPALLQNRNQSPGNFEVVVPLAAGGLQHFFRNNGAAGTPWVAGPVFATGRVYSAAAMIQSSFEGGNLEVIARSGSQLWTTWRNASGWQVVTQISVDGVPINATGIPSFIQSASGNFELVLPTPAGLAHYFRDNFAYAYPWRAPTIIDPINTYSAAALIQSSYGSGTNLEVVGRRSGGALAGFYRSGGVWSWNQVEGGVTKWAGQVFGAEPCCDATVKGKWSDPVYTNTMGLHASLLRNGKVLLFGFDNAGMASSQVFDPNTGALSSTGLYQPHLFCSGHTFLPDGRLWISGGHTGNVDGSHTFNPATNTITAHQRMAHGRWYPTLARLGGGRVLTISGSTLGGVVSPTNPLNNTWQLFDPTTNVMSAEFGVPVPFSTDGSAMELYPWVFALPDGRVAVHSRQTTRFLNPVTQSWASTQVVTNYPYSRTYPGYGSALLQLLSPADSYRVRLLLIGGGGLLSMTDSDDTVAATNTVEQLDLGAASPAWQSRAPMSSPRVLNTAILLPNGTVFSMGGSTMGRADHGRDPVMFPEIYDPAANTWTQMCSMRVPRLYHSTALLLPDARVLTAGRDHIFNDPPYNWPERRIEIFTPPYLSSSNPRPVISTVPTVNVGYNALFSVTVNALAVAPANITRAVLIAPGSVTHGFDMNQRGVELAIVSRTSGGLSLRSPLNSAVAPPGDYMLFLLSNAGVPSVAKFVIVR